MFKSSEINLCHRKFSLTSSNKNRDKHKFIRVHCLFYFILKQFFEKNEVIHVPPPLLLSLTFVF